MKIYIMKSEQRYRRQKGDIGNQRNKKKECQ
jgi:hypothetical protein